MESQNRHRSRASLSNLSLRVIRPLSHSRTHYSNFEAAAVDENFFRSSSSVANGPLQHRTMPTEANPPRAPVHQIQPSWQNRSVSMPHLDKSSSRFTKWSPSSWFSRLLHPDQYLASSSDAVINSSKPSDSAKTPTPHPFLRPTTVKSIPEPQPRQCSESPSWAFPNTYEPSCLPPNDPNLIVTFPSRLAPNPNSKRSSLVHTIHSVREKAIHVRRRSMASLHWYAHSEALEEGRQILSPDEDVFRRHTETTNLRKGKINQLTGNGRIQRKSVNSTNELTDYAIVPSPLIQSLPSPDVNNRRLVMSLIKPENNSQTHLLHANPQRTTDLRHGSLSRSVSIALDKLSNHTTSNKMGVLKSSKSLFTLNKGVRRHKTEVHSKFTPVYRHGSRKVIKRTDLASDIDRPLILQTATPVTSSPLEAQDIGKDTTNLPETPIKKAVWINPLKQHPNTTDFAIKPDHITGLPTPVSSGKAKILKGEDDDNQDAIHDATLYNELSGNLTHYSRQTPSTPAISAAVDQGSPADTEYTPTKKSGKAREMIKGVLRKTTSFFNIKDQAKDGKEEEEGSGVRLDSEIKSDGVVNEDENLIAPAPVAVLRHPRVRRVEDESKRRGGYGVLDLVPASPNPKRNSF